MENAWPQRLGLQQVPGCSWCPHPADNLCQQENNDTFPQVTVRLTKAQEGLSHPDGEVARED